MLDYGCMKKTLLSDMAPESATFNVGEIEATLRPCTLDDWAWLQATFGDEVDQKLKKMPFKDLVRISYRLMDQDSRGKFRSVTIKEIDENGDEVEAKIPGYQMLGRALEGLDSIQGLTEAFMKSMGFGNLSDEDVADLEKKVRKMEKQKVKSKSAS